METKSVTTQTQWSIDPVQTIQLEDSTHKNGI